MTVNSTTESTDYWCPCKKSTLCITKTKMITGRTRYLVECPSCGGTFFEDKCFYSSDEHELDLKLRLIKSYIDVYNEKGSHFSPMSPIEVSMMDDLIYSIDTIIDADIPDEGKIKTIKSNLEKMQAHINQCRILPISPLSAKLSSEKD